MKKRVLYVDDEPSNLKALKRLFRGEDFEFITCESPIEALNDLDKTRPAVVISDQRMPEMTGVDFLENVGNRLPDSVRIILTGHADLETAIEAINKGCVFRFIQKPWNDEELKAQVKSALEHQASTIRLRTIVETLADEIVDNEKALKSVRLFAEAVSGELRRPLIVIGGYAQLLHAYLPDDELFERYLSNIRGQVDVIEKTASRIQSMLQKLADHEK